MPSPPSFLCFVTDQQRWDHVGYAGSHRLRTPHIDALAASGSWCSRFYVASPVCMPNRATFMTGRMPSLHGVRHNGIALDHDQSTFVHLLRAAGYRTGLVGKCHLQNFVGETPGYAPETFDSAYTPPPDEHREAWRKRYSRNAYAAEQRELWRRHPARSIPLPYYGFDDVHLCVGHGDNVSGHYEQWLRDRDTAAAERFGPAHAERTSETAAPQTYKPARDASLYPTTYVRDQCVALLERYSKSPDTPFFIQCSFPDPHHPFTPPGAYWDRYAAADVALPASFYAPPSPADIPPLAELRRAHAEGRGQSRWTTPFMTDEARAKEIVAKTYGQIAMLDDAVGEICDALRRQGLEQRTVVSYMSDHGDWMGDHGLFLKGPLHYQSLIKAPFVWRDPDRRLNRGRLDAMTGTIDLARTILDRAGLAPYNGIQGRSLLPLLSGDEVWPAREMLIEQQTQYAYLGLEGPVRLATLVDERHRLTLWQDQSFGELYDLREDPQELVNLWGEPGARSLREALTVRLVHLMLAHQDTSPFPTDKG